MPCLVKPLIFASAFAPIAALLALGQSPALARVPQAKPALWEVSDADTKIYLFGTIHLLPDDLKWRTAQFDQAVAGSQQLIVETIFDQQNLQKIQQAQFALGIRQGLPPIAQRIAPAKVAQLRAAIAKSGVPERAYDQMETWLAAITLLSVQFRDMGLKGSHGPEEILRQQFLSSQRPIGELGSRYTSHHLRLTAR